MGRDAHQRPVIYTARKASTRVSCKSIGIPPVIPLTRVFQGTRVALPFPRDEGNGRVEERRKKGRANQGTSKTRERNSRLNIRSQSLSGGEIKR